MKETLTIKNFGPIEKVNIQIGKLTILIGEQASGKSTIAKVLSVCRYFSYIVNFELDSIDEQNEFHENQQFLHGLRDWGLDSYLSNKENKSEICYENELYTFEFKINAKKPNYDQQYNELQTRIEAKPGGFAQLLEQFYELRNHDLSQKNKPSDFYNPKSWSPNENFYRLNVKKIMDNPLFIPVERGFQSVSVSKESLLPDAIYNELGKINRIVRNYKDIHIKPLDLTYRTVNNLGQTKKDQENDFYDLHTGASGYQSTIPTVVSIKHYNEAEKRNRTFIVEEPELNLFPTTQKKQLHFFVEYLNKYGNSFLIPTHSPYFISVLNDLLMAHKKGQINEIETKELVKKECWLDIENVSVYQIINGKSENIVDEKIGLIKDNIIDDISDDMNDKFDKLLDIK